MIRNGPIFSPKRNGDKIVTTMGANKSIAVASAIGIYFRAIKNAEIAVTLSAPRTNCLTGDVGRIAAKPCFGIEIKAMTANVPMN